MSKDYWVIGDFDVDSTSEITRFLDEQREFLKERTEGNVIAVFTPRRVNTLVRTATAMQKMLSGESVLHRNDGIKDASSLYDTSYYEFYITDKRKQYELELFELSLADNYPLLVFNVDDTIRVEAGLETEPENRYEINSLSEFIEIYSKIVSTNKVSYIINRLIKMMKEQDEKGIV